MIGMSLLTSLRDGLIRSGQTVAVAESATGGALQSAIVAAPDAMRFFQGGITAYNLGQKSRHLHIEPIHAQEVNCVSERVAAEMAAGACRLFRSDWGISITGYVTPVPESGNKVFAWYGIAKGEDIVETRRLDALDEDPEHIRHWYAEKSLEAFLACLKRAGK